MLKHLASIFDSRGLDIYRGACNVTLSWDEQLTEPLKAKWIKWSENLLEAYQQFKINYYPLTHTFLEMQVLKVSQLYYMLLFIKMTEEIKECYQQKEILEKNIGITTS